MVVQIHGYRTRPQRKMAKFGNRIGRGLQLLMRARWQPGRQRGSCLLQCVECRSRILYPLCQWPNIEAASLANAKVGLAWFPVPTRLGR